MNKLSLFLVAPVIAILSVSAQAAVLFSDDFESGLSNWTAGSGQIVADPLGGSNDVLSFSGLNAGGDIFSSNAFFSSNSNMFTLTFDYLGDNNNSGGFIGYSQSFPGSHVWLAGSDTNYSGTSLWQANSSGSLQDKILVGDNTWQSYSFTFAANFNPIHLMLEDFVGSDNVAGNAYFDNIVLTDATVPEPSVLALFGLGLAGMGLASRRKSKKQ